MQNETDLSGIKGYSAIDFVIGLLITLAASIINALGLNVTKLDHTRSELLPPAARSPDWKRGLWWIGMVLYIASQVLGSTLALEYLRAEYVAPLGATSLIFNFIFAYLLVGTPVTRTDIFGTLVIVVGVIGVVVFGNNRTSTESDNLTLAVLKSLWARKEWLIYLLLGEVVTVMLFWLSTVVAQVKDRRIEDERGSAEEVDTRVAEMLQRRQPPSADASLVAKVSYQLLNFQRQHARFKAQVTRRVETYSQSLPETTIRKLSGLLWSFTGGLLAAQTLIFAKSIVKLLSSSLSDPNLGSPLTSPLTWIILIILVVAAVSQVYCLNASLKAYDSTFGIPIFFATYTIFGFINSLIYLDELDTYQLWVFLCIWVSIAVLVAGVVMLSIKKAPAPKRSLLPAALDDEETAGASERGEEQEGGASLSKRVTSLVESGIRDERVVKSRGWLGRRFFGSEPTPDSGPGEESRSKRRQRQGLQRLPDEEDGGRDDDGSIFAPESSSGARGEGGAIELQDVVVHDTPPDNTVFDLGEETSREEGEDPFGDFEEYDSGSEEVPVVKATI